MELPPNIYFICVHKGASTFIAQHLFPSLAQRCERYQMYYVGREYVDWFHRNRETLALQPTANEQVLHQRTLQMLKERPLPRSGGLIGRLYPNHVGAICEHLNDSFPPKNSVVFIMRRDPRDALVSLYYSSAFSHNEKALLTTVDENFLKRQRTRIQGTGIYNWLKSILSTPTTQSVLEEFNRCADMIAEHPAVTDLPYELLVTQPRDWLSTFVERANLTNWIDDDWLNRMCQHLQPPETVDHYQHKRRVTPGNWKEVFDDNLRELMRSQVGDRMEQLNYSWD